MELGVRYRGSFRSRAGVVWRVDILQNGYGGTRPGVLNFPSDIPLEIEWGETDKIDQVQGSSATLKIVSDTDRRFVDLYTVDVGAVRLDVYRAGKLYWSGCIDTELYEEPYSFESGYEVSLTFSDFACLDRLDWMDTGLASIHDIVDKCLDRCGINYGGVKKLISTSQYLYGQELSLEETFVNQENFYDEDGQPLKAREVLEEVLKPFGLRIIQKAGNIYVYDLNKLFHQEPSRLVWGYSDDAVLGVDKIYNNVKLTFSPYGDAEMMKGTVEEDPALTAESGGILVKVNYERDSYGSLKALDGFRFHHNSTLKSNMELSGGAEFFQIRSIYSGSDETGVVATMKRGDYAVAEEDGASTKVKHVLMTPKDCGTIKNGNISTTPIITCPKVFLNYVSYLRMNYKLRINLNLLFDVRYNPFEEAGDYNDNASWRNGIFNLSKHDGPYQNMQDWCNFGYVPIKLSLVDKSGKTLYHYENRSVLDSTGYGHTGAKWVSGTASWGDAYLCYYDFDDRKKKTGFGGWAKNKQIIGYYRDALPQQWKTIDDGEFIDLPPVGGFLVLEIGSGIHQFDYKREVKNIYKFCRWIMYKNPSITLCKKNYKEVEMEDIEDYAWLNKSAKEELQIETIVGTITENHGVPNAKGQIFKGDHSVFSTFARAGVSDRLERLLIGTVYSQYAARHNTLSGTAKLLPGFGIYTEKSTPGVFILLSEVQNCIEDESVIKMAELSEDNYEGIEYE